MFLFTTNSNKNLGALVAKEAGLSLGRAELNRFADGEIRFVLGESVKDQSVYVLGSTFPPAENLLELVTVINTLKINGANEITLILPYFGYAKSDRLDRPNLPINARLFAEFIEHAGATKLMAINLHSPLVEGFFSIPKVHLSAIPLMADYIKKLSLPDMVIATPDFGGKARAVEFAHLFDTDHVVVVEKMRPADDQAKVIKVHDGVEGKNIVLVDDMVQTGGTLIAAGEALKQMGAKDIYVVVSHFVFSANALPLLEGRPYFAKIIITDTIPVPERISLPDKFEVLTVGNLLSKAIQDELGI